jgi:hypothetical protein
MMVVVKWCWVAVLLLLLVFACFNGLVAETNPKLSNHHDNYHHSLTTVEIINSSPWPLILIINHRGQGAVVVHQNVCPRDMVVHHRRQSRHEL